MKRLLTVALLLTLSLTAFGQKKAWVFEKAFPDTSTFKTSIHGLAVDGAGKVWVQTYYGMAGDSVFQVSTGTNRITRAVRVYNPDGTLIRKIQIMSGNGVQDTLFFVGLGLRTGPTGDVYLATGPSTLGVANYVYKVDYKTYQALGRITAYNTAGANNTVTGPGVDDLDEVFVSTVYPGNPAKIFDGKTFAFVGNAIDTVKDYGRSMDVSPDGNDIYSTRFSGNSFVYHCDIGSIGPYVLQDTLLMGMSIESSALNKTDGYVYFGSGGQTSSLPPYSNYRWYAYDRTTKTVKDSILWNNPPAPPSEARPRAIAFSASGDTAWVGQFNSTVPGVQMFIRKIVSVEPVDNSIPSGYALSQNYPNPFNPSTEIQFSIPAGGFTTLKVYDVLGKEVATLVNENLNPGTFKTTLDGSALSSGTYIYRLVSGSMQVTKKMMLLK
jgi:hypothetical protein